MIVGPFGQAACIFLLFSPYPGGCIVIIFGHFGHVQTAAFAVLRQFLFFSAVLAMFRLLHFSSFWPFSLDSDGCIFIICGLFGHAQEAALLLFSAVVAIFRHVHFFFVGPFGHVQAAAFS